MSAKQTKYLRMPTTKPHQLFDLLTSLDDALREVIYGLDLIIRYLSLVTGRLPEQVVAVVPPPAPPGVEVVVPTVPQVIPALPQRIVSLPYPLDIIGCYEVEVSETEAKRVILDGDLFILTADSDIKFGKRTDSMYPLWAGSYLIMSRSTYLNELYIQSLTGTAKAYLLFLGIETEGR
jgi:hypothetical protein